MSHFERELPSFRLAQTHHGDDLQSIAAREMGDANRWPELIWINSLVYPYLTDSQDLASDRILLTGSLIRVPAPTATPVDEPKRAQVFGRDCFMQGRQLVVDDGDFAVASGVDNLTQQLQHAIITPRGQLKRHAGYGCLVWTLHGTVQGPTAAMLGAQYVRATLEADYRVSQVHNATAEVFGDALHISAQAEAIDGGTVDIANNRQNPPAEDPTDDDFFIMSGNFLHHFVHVTLPRDIGPPYRPILDEAFVAQSENLHEFVHLTLPDNIGQPYDYPKR